MNEQITQQDIDAMIRHWLATPMNTYLGSDYGFDKQAVLFTPLSMSSADEMIAKLVRDVPILQMLDQGAINLYSVPIPPDKLQIFLQIGESTFTVT